MRAVSILNPNVSVAGARVVTEKEEPYTYDVHKRLVNDTSYGVYYTKKQSPRVHRIRFTYYYYYYIYKEFVAVCSDTTREQRCRTVIIYCDIVPLGY